jgi:hypothetical protein
MKKIISTISPLNRRVSNDVTIKCNEEDLEKIASDLRSIFEIEQLEI